jgi:WD40 repeat protein
MSSLFPLVAVGSLVVLQVVMAPQTEKPRPRTLDVGRNVTDCCFITDKVLLISSSEGILTAFDVATGERGKRYSLGRQYLGSLMAVDKGKRVICVRGDNEIVQFDLQLERSTVIARLQQRIVRIVISPDEKVCVVACADGAVRLYSIGRGQQLGCFKPSFRSSDPKPLDISVSSDGMYLAIAYDNIQHSADSQVHICALPSLQMLYNYRIDRSFARSVSFNPRQSDVLALPGRGNAVCIWPLSDITKQRLFKDLPARPMHIRYTRDGVSLLFTDIKGSLFIRRGANNPELLHKYPDPPATIYQLSLAPNGGHFALRLFDSDEKKDKIILWSLQ